MVRTRPQPQTRGTQVISVIDAGYVRSSEIRHVPVRLAFIRPLVPSSAARPPEGGGWLHEPKWNGFRFQVIKDGSDVRFYSNTTG